MRSTLSTLWLAAAGISTLSVVGCAAPSGAGAWPEATAPAATEAARDPAPAATADDATPATPPPAAAPPADDRPRHALVIGNATYGGGADLSNPGRDARAVEAALTEIGFTVTRHEDLDALDMKDALAQFAHTLRKTKAVGLFYFAGHGLQAGEVSYLMPARSAPFGADFTQQAVSLNHVLSELTTADNPLNIIVLDACRTPPKVAPGDDAVGQAFLQAPPRTLIAYATAPGTIAADGAPDTNGVYTGILVEEIKTPGWTIEQVFRSVRRRVYEGTGARQLPWEATSLFSKLVLVPSADGAPAADPEPLRLAQTTVQGRARGAPIAGTLAPLSAARLAGLRSVIAAEDFSAMKLAHFELGTRGVAMTAAQLRALLDVFEFEADKLTAIRIARRQLSDPHAIDVLLEGLAFEVDREAARALFTTGPNAIDPALSAEALAALANKTKAKRGYRAQLDAIESGIRGHTLTVDQLIVLLRALRFDQYMLEAVRRVRARVRDPEHAARLKAIFRVARSGEEAVRLLR